MGILSSDWEKLEDPKYIICMKIIQSFGASVSPQLKSWINSVLYLLPKTKYGSLRAHYGDSNKSLQIMEKWLFLRALARHFLIWAMPSYPWRFGNCWLWDTKISNRMQTESPHLSNSDEVARDCKLPAPGHHIWKLEKTRHHDHIILCESSTWKIYRILASLQITHPQYFWRDSLGQQIKGYFEGQGI